MLIGDFRESIRRNGWEQVKHAEYGDGQMHTRIDVFREHKNGL